MIADAVIIENTPFAQGMYALVLDAPEVARAVEPGQFVELGLGFPDLVLRRPFSVFRVFGDGRLEIRYQVLGEGTRRLSAFSAGAGLSLVGPLGNRWPVSADLRRALVVAGGIGSAPLAMLVEELYGAGVAVTMVQGAQSADRLVETEFFAPLCEELVIATDDGSLGCRGLVTEPLGELLETRALSASQVKEDGFVAEVSGLSPLSEAGVPSDTELRSLVSSSLYDVAYLCGPEPMMEACAALCAEAGVPAYVSLERLMACGVGACLSCVVPTVHGLRRVCADGPIFAAEEVLFDDARSSRVR